MKRLYNEWQSPSFWWGIFFRKILSFGRVDMWNSGLIIVAMFRPWWDFIEDERTASPIFPYRDTFIESSNHLITKYIHSVWLSCHCVTSTAGLKPNKQQNGKKQVLLPTSIFLPYIISLKIRSEVFFFEKKVKKVFLRIFKTSPFEKSIFLHFEIKGEKSN